MKLNIKSPAALALLISLSATGCLKDKDYKDGAIQSLRTPDNPIKPVEIKLTASNTSNVLSLSFSTSDNDTTVNLIPVNLATAGPAAQDLHVTLTQNNQILADYNANNGTDYAVAKKFSLVNAGGVVVIPKGSNTAYLQIKFKPSDFQDSTYALGYTISKVDESGYTISGNMQNGLVIINIRNKYDGVYTRRGFVLRAGDNALTGPTGPDQIQLTTVDATTVSWIENHQWAGGALLAASVSNPIWTVEPDNSVTVSSAGGPFPAGLKNFPGYNSRYDPATKTFYVKATWGGGPGSREMTDTLVYVEPRP